ncbi:MAG: hypothetical protein ACYC0E_15640, partial [Acidimicrobiales bacterium]
PSDGSRRLVVAAVATVALAAAVAGAVLTASGGAPGWDDRSLQVVGTPASAQGVVVVLDVTAAHHLELTGVRAADGSILWHRPYSASEVTPGVGFGPVVSDGTVLDASPAGGPADPAVRVEGLAVRTGQPLWSLRPALVLSDAPTVCAGGRDICVAVWTSATTTALALVDPADGAVSAVVPGPERALAVHPGSATTAGSLWETSDAAPTLTEVSNGSTAWTRTVASLFGGGGYDPGEGWYFVAGHGVDIGSVGLAPHGNLLRLADVETVAIAAGDGTVRWRTKGFYGCDGGLFFLTADVVCRYSGTVRRVGHSVSMAGVGLTLEGVDARTGRVTWSTPVLGAEPLTAGTDVPFVDADHVVVELPSGRRVVLDTRRGTTAPVAAGEVFWCEHDQRYRVTTAAGGSADGQRAAAPVFDACSASGSPLDALPARGIPAVGLRASGLFVWPTPHGLEAAPLPG